MESTECKFRFADMKRPGNILTITCLWCIQHLPVGRLRAFCTLLHGILRIPAFVFVACTPVVMTEQSIPAELQIKASGAAGIRDSLDVFVFDDDEFRRLDTYQRLPPGRSAQYIACTEGPKIIAAVTGSGRERSDWAAINTFDGLCAQYSDAWNDSVERPLMTGTAKKKSGTDGARVDISLTPLLSRVTLRSIRCDFTGRPYEGQKLTGGKVYLSNLNTRCRLMEEEDFRTESIEYRSEERPLPGQIGKTAVSTGMSMYCYPNTNPVETAGSPFTRLVIEGEVDGRTWYWPIDINREWCGPVSGTPGIGRGQEYIFDVTLTRTGTSGPDIAASSASYGAILSIKPWEEVTGWEEHY